MRKAQIQQIFIYVMAAVIVIIILMYGYRAITHFSDKAEDVSYIKFKTDLESAVSLMASDFGSISRETLMLGKGYSQVCFVDSEIIGSPDGLPGIDLIINDSIASGVDKNVFLLGASVGDSFSVGKIRVESGIVCIPVIGGRLKVQLEGLGDRTKISEW